MNFCCSYLISDSDRLSSFLNIPQHERSTYNILAKQLGEDDTRTRDSANWMKTFQLRDAQVCVSVMEECMYIYIVVISTLFIDSVNMVAERPTAICNPGSCSKGC
jgi:hypothetical protein